MNRLAVYAKLRDHWTSKLRRIWPYRHSQTGRHLCRQYVHEIRVWNSAIKHRLDVRA